MKLFINTLLAINIFPYVAFAQEATKQIECSNIDTLGIVGLVAGIVSVILAIVAIWQAVHFYTQGKSTESRVETALAAIQGQVQTLQAVNGRTLDRLTKYVTSPKNDGISQAAQALTSTLKETTAIFSQLNVPTPNTSDATLRDEIIMAYIALWYYSAKTNVWASFNLPPVQEFDESNPNHVLIKSTIDRSFSDFQIISGLVHGLTQDQIKSSPLYHLYAEIESEFIHLIGDTSQHFSRQAKHD